jgi:hypothetical protein
MALEVLRLLMVSNICFLLPSHHGFDTEQNEHSGIYRGRFIARQRAGFVEGQPLGLLTFPEPFEFPQH